MAVSRGGRTGQRELVKKNSDYRETEFEVHAALERVDG
jgi:hypothetical protein